MIPQDVAMGIGIIAVCLMFLSQERRFLAETSKGRRLVGWCGPAKAPWVLRGLLLAGMVFGGLLAYGTIKPIQW